MVCIEEQIWMFPKEKTTSNDCVPQRITSCSTMHKSTHIFLPHGIYNKNKTHAGIVLLIHKWKICKMNSHNQITNLFMLNYCISDKKHIEMISENAIVSLELGMLCDLMLKFCSIGDMVSYYKC